MRSDVTDEQWAYIEPIIERKHHNGGRKKYASRDMFNGIIYVLTTGCSWADLPLCYPPYKRVHERYMRWIARGVFEAALTELRQKYRLMLGKDEEPTVAIIDSKTAQTIFNHSTVGVDGHKKNQGQ